MIHDSKYQKRNEKQNTIGYLHEKSNRNVLLEKELTYIPNSGNKILLEPPNTDDLTQMVMKKNNVTSEKARNMIMNCRTEDGTRWSICIDVLLNYHD